jgi:hypothetical protein
MRKTLRAFAWLRFRLFVNSLERTGSRDTLERFSLAIEKLGPILAGALLIPSGLMLAALGAGSGYALAQGDVQSLLVRLPRYILIAVPLLSVLGPLLLPAGDRTNPIRMLLLPIGRGPLYVAQSAASLGDFWILLTLPLVVCIPIGLTAGGAPGAAVIALVAGALLVIVVIAISCATSSLLHLAVRDRRRGELLALLFIIIIPLLSMLPSMIALASRDGGESTHRRRLTAPAWVNAAAGRAFTLYPTELYTRATRAAAGRDVVPVARSVGALAAGALLLNLFGVYVFGKVLESPGSTSARRQVPSRAAWDRRLPWLSAGASAVALAQLRLALRTSRGRSILLGPILVAFVYVVLNSQNRSGFHFNGLTVDTGLVIACAASFISVVSILPIALNQFAVDKAGLTLVLLSPLSDRDYLTGKAVGNALIAALPATLCITVSFIVLASNRSIASWVSIPVALLSVGFLAAPAAAALSAMFPRVVDMNSIGRGSNAHGLAGLLGLVTFLLAAASNVAVAVAASYWFGRPIVTLGLLLAWCGISVLISLLLFVPARRIFATRRENLAML